jgi:hypothetical protein
MGSSRNTDNKILGVITPSRAELFLRRLANLHPVDGAVAEQLRAKYPEIAEPCASGRSWLETLSWAQFYLRRAWDAPDERHRKWYLHEMRRDYRESVVMASFAGVPASETPHGHIFSLVPGVGTDTQRVDKRLIDPPPPTAFEAAVSYFQERIGDRAKHCGHVDCPAPYFIAEKRWQKFCTEACAGPANRESKRKWWHDNKAKGGL